MTHVAYLPNCKIKMRCELTRVREYCSNRKLPISQFDRSSNDSKFHMLKNVRENNFMLNVNCIYN